ncbi:MAG: molybdenum cofactor biosynthesis protein MoaE [Sumerlaeia bacterium]
MTHHAKDLIEITAESLSLDAMVRAIGHGASASDGPGLDPEAGALVTFSGIVRETEGDAAITHLDYEFYPRMAEREIEKLFETARGKWPLRRLAMVHRTGPVPVGEPSILVGVSAGHRAEAFAAAKWLMDEMKKSVPIWKKAPGD